jgi:hypothetical protein
MKKRILIPLLLFCFCVISSAEVNSGAGVIFPVLELGAWPRSLAMAGAYTAAADDIGAVYWNPAGLALLDKTGVALTYDKWFMDSYYQYLMAGFPIGDNSGIGFNFFYMNLGYFEKRDLFGVPLGSITSSTYTGATAGFGQRVSENILLGASIKIIFQAVSDATYTGAAFDAGTILKFDPVSVGIIVQNMGYNSDFSMPTSLKAGLSFKAIDSRENKLLFSAEAKTFFNDAGYYKFGGEYAYDSLLFIRAGYELSGAKSNLDGLTGICAGLGLKLGDFIADYAFVPFGDLGYTHRIATTILFGETRIRTVPVENVSAPAADKKTMAANKTDPVIVKKAPAVKETATAEVKGRDTLFLQGLKAEEKKDYKTAVLKYRASIKLDSRNTEAWKRLGMVYVAQGQNDYAITCFENAQKLAPDDMSIFEMMEKTLENTLEKNLQ